MKYFKNIVIKEVPKITCDVCGEQATPNDYAYHEFISINQHWFANLCGDSLTVVEHNNDKDEDIELNKLVVQREN